MKISNGTVKYPAGNKTFESKYSDKPQQNIVIAMEDGSEEKIYFDQGRYPHSQLQKGQPVQIIYETRNGRMTRKLVADADAPSNEPVKQQSQVKANVPKREVNVEALVIKEAKVLWAAMKIVQDVVGKDVPVETVRAMAVGIMLNNRDVDFNALLVPKPPVSDQRPIEDEKDLPAF